jgi:hypothetical protein
VDASPKVEWSFSSSLCAKDISLYVMKAYGGVEVQTHLFLTSTLDKSRKPHAPSDIHPQKENESPVPINDEVR